MNELESLESEKQQIERDIVKHSHIMLSFDIMEHITKFLIPLFCLASILAFLMPYAMFPIFLSFILIEGIKIVKNLKILVKDRELVDSLKFKSSIIDSEITSLKKGEDKRYASYITHKQYLEKLKEEISKQNIEKIKVKKYTKEY